MTILIGSHTYMVGSLLRSSSSTLSSFVFVCDDFTGLSVRVQGCGDPLWNRRGGKSEIYGTKRSKSWEWGDASNTFGFFFVCACSWSVKLSFRIPSEDIVENDDYFDRRTYTILLYGSRCSPTVRVSWHSVRVRACGTGNHVGD